MYGMDLRDALWGLEPFGARHLISLVYNLPPNSATFRATDPHEGWDQVDELLATIVDMLGVNNHLLVATNTDAKERSRLPKPSAFPRPYEDNENLSEDEHGALSSSDEMRAFFMRSDTGEVRIG